MTFRQSCKIEGCSKPGIRGAHVRSLQRHTAKYHPAIKKSPGRPKLPQKRSKKKLNELNAEYQQTWRRNNPQSDKCKKAAQTKRADKREHIEATAMPTRKRTLWYTGCYLNEPLKYGAATPVRSNSLELVDALEAFTV